MKDSDNRKSFWSKVNDIWTAEYTRIGYDQGFKDALDGKPKNPLSFKNIKNINIINLTIWGVDRAFDTFKEGYDQGYLDGLRVKQILGSNYGKHEHNVSQGGQTTMAFIGRDSYQAQLRIMHDFEPNLKALHDYIGAIYTSYDKQITYAQDHGYMEEIIEILRKKYSQFYSMCIDLEQDLRRHKQHLQDMQRIIRDLMNAANTD